MADIRVVTQGRISPSFFTASFCCRLSPDNPSLYGRKKYEKNPISIAVVMQHSSGGKPRSLPLSEFQNKDDGVLELHN